MATDTLSNWQWASKNVNSDVTGSKYVSAESSIVLAGPPTLASNEANNSDLYVIGIKGNMQIMQNRANMRLFEIGAIRGYIIPSKVIPSIILSSMLVHGPSLIAAMYKYAFTKGTAPFNNEVTKEGMGFNDALLSITNQGAKSPVGLALIIRDNTDAAYAAVYLENCYLSSSVLSTDSTGIIFREDLNVDFVNVKPIRVMTPQ